MSEEITNIIGTIDADLGKAVVSSYESVNKAYFNEDYEGTLSKSGKFVENVFILLLYIISGQKLQEIKQNQMTDIFDKLENSDSKKFHETIRIVIPRVALTLYTLRSKMGGEHVKSIEPDFIDAKYAMSSCDWIVSELLRICDKRDTSKITQMIQNVKSHYHPKLDSFKVQLAEKIDDLSIPHLILIILRTNESQSKTQIIKIIKEIGRNIESWFCGGNFRKRVIKQGYVIPVGKDGTGEELFSLTIKGIITAEKLIEGLRTQPSVKS